MFLNTVKIKVLAFGNQVMLRRLVAQLDEYEFEVITCADSAVMIEKLSNELFDIVIVEHSAREAGFICSSAAGFGGVPVIVMMQEKFADWNSLRQLDADGYISDDTGSEELTARIRAYCRRRTPAVEQV
jgi:DNA-binding response OmpR family regulator